MTRSAPTTTKVTVKVRSVIGTAVSPADFSAVSLTTLTFLPGQTRKLVTVKVAGDLLDEADETFTLVLSSPVGATIARRSGTVRIVDNDATPTLAIAPQTLAEGSAGLAARTVSVSLSAPSGRPVSVGWATVAGTATLGDDLEPSTGTVSFPPGSTSQAITLSVDGDTVDEATERFYLQLSAPVSVGFATAYWRVNLADDDAPMTPTLFDFAPATGQARGVTLKGVAQSGGTVVVHAAAGCAGSPVLSTTAEALASGIAVTAAENAVTTWSVRSVNAAAESSACSNAASFTHDDLGPAMPGDLGFAGGSPANANAPALTGAAEPGSRVRVFLDACLTSPFATATAATLGGAGIPLGVVPDDSTSTYWVDTVDAAGNGSGCVPVTYVEDSTAPDHAFSFDIPGVGQAAGPEWFGVGTKPSVLGLAELGATLEWYAVDPLTGECAGPVLASGPVDAGAMRVPMEARAQTRRAVVVRDVAGNALPCTSTVGVTYTEQSTEVEPNNSIGTASPGASGMGVTSLFGELLTSSDIDHYSLTVSSNAILRAETLESSVGPTCASFLLDTNLRLFSASGVEIAFDDDSGPGRCSGFQRSVLAGDYVVMVDASKLASPGLPYPLPYELRLTVTALPPSTSVGEAEANDTLDQANGLGAVTTSQWRDATGAVTPTGDLDWYSLTLATTTTVVLETLDGATSTCASNHEDTHVTLLDADKVTVLGINDDSGDGFCSKLSLSLAAGTYYVQVKASPFATGADQTFDYRLRVGTPGP